MAKEPGGNPGRIGGEGRGAYLGVKHDGAEDTGVLHGHAEVVERLLVVGMGPVGEVESGDVHAGPEELLDHLNGPGGGAERADDLRLRPLLQGERSGSGSSSISTEAVHSPVDLHLISQVHDADRMGQTLRLARRRGDHEPTCRKRIEKGI